MVVLLAFAHLYYGLFHFLACDFLTLLFIVDYNLSPFIIHEPHIFEKRLFPLFFFFPSTFLFFSDSGSILCCWSASPSNESGDTSRVHSYSSAGCLAASPSDRSGYPSRVCGSLASLMFCIDIAVSSSYESDDSSRLRSSFNGVDIPPNPSFLLPLCFLTEP